MTENALQTKLDQRVVEILVIAHAITISVGDSNATSTVEGILKQAE